MGYMLQGLSLTFNSLLDVTPKSRVSSSLLLDTEETDTINQSLIIKSQENITNNFQYDSIFEDNYQLSSIERSFCYDLGDSEESSL